jgi:hypothetical protein
LCDSSDTLLHGGYRLGDGLLVVVDFSQVRNRDTVSFEMTQVRLLVFHSTLLKYPRIG